jgi:hypothetical protein
MKAEVLQCCESVVYNIIAGLYFITLFMCGMEINNSIDVTVSIFRNSPNATTYSRIVTQLHVSGITRMKYFYEAEKQI